MRQRTQQAISSAAGQPGWVVCRKLTEIRVPETVSLSSWAEQGRIRPDDYLVHPDLDLCVQANELAELRMAFRRTTMRRLGKISSLLAWGVSAIWSEA